MFECLKKSFPYFRIVKQFYINVENNKYFFDFYIIELSTLIECHGEQHLKFVKHYHGDMVGFNRQKNRDLAKEIYASENNYTLVKFFYSELNKLSSEYIKDKIYGTIVD
jgi:very-short-patch-repair endonuclease